jgi:raffinose/stachyose/melibiose transport system permease protein
MGTTVDQGKVKERPKARHFWQGMSFQKKYLPWLFILPITLLHLAVVVIPVIQGMYYAFTDWSGIGEAEFVGLDNFRKLFFEDVNFHTAFINNLVWMAIWLTIPFAMALIVATLLTQVRRGGLFYRSALFIPYVLPPIAATFIWRTLYSPRFGLGAQLAAWGIPGLDIAYLGRTDTALPAIALTGIWTWWGFLMVLFLTAMQAVPSDLYDAARIDGANRWQEFLNITFPAIRPTVLFMLVITAASLFSSFQFVFILTGGGPAGSSELVATYLYKQAFQRFEMGYASAIGLTVAALSALLIGMHSFLRRRGWDI